MSIKIEILDGALVMHDTVDIKVIGESPKALVYYDVSELDNNSVIKLVNIDQTKEVQRHWQSQAISANVVDGSDVAYTIASWKTFARTELGV